MDTEQVLFSLCGAVGPAGAEQKAAECAAEELKRYAQVRFDALGNVIGEIIPKGYTRHVLLDAHIDEIGLIVTHLQDGFVRVDKTGGVDLRTLPDGEVTIWGEKPVDGIFCAVPPHLSKAEDRRKVPALPDAWIDTGLCQEELERWVRPGDRVTAKSVPRRLAGGRVSSKALDDRACVTVILRALSLLPQDHHTRITVLFSVQEETGQAGAQTGAFQSEATEAVALDVSFASTPDSPKHKCGELGKGPMIGYAPVLSHSIYTRLCSLAKEADIPYQTEIMGADSGTNGDCIAVSKAGRPTGLLSIPQRYMHTPVEVVDLKDLENTARLLVLYLTKEETAHA